MFAYLIALCTALLPLFGGGHQLSISYYEKGELDLAPPYTPQFMRGEEGKVDKGMMLFYEQRLGGAPPFVSFYGGATLGRWNRDGSEFYTSCLFGSSKIWIFSLPFFHPYIEISTLGPTLLIKGYAAPTFLLQNFLGIGVELGGSLGLILDLRMMRYYSSNLSSAPEGLQVPTLLSLGCLF